MIKSPPGIPEMLHFYLETGMDEVKATRTSTAATQSGRDSVDRVDRSVEYGNNYSVLLDRAPKILCSQESA